MRDIKFRGKMINKYAEEWFYGDLIKVIDEKRIINYYIVTESYNSKNMNIELNTCQTPKVKKDTIGQYTGLKDKNGKEIYEGDILKIPEWARQDIQELCVCIYNQENQVSDIIGFGLYIKDGYSSKYKILVMSDEWDEFEVIGNIYDNKELLEE